jgi:hypothetical protein
MRIVCMTNEGQLPMMKNMLNSAMKVGMDMKLFQCYIVSSDKEAAKYNTTEFKKLTTRKLEVISANMHDTTLWVDNDIVFFENCLNDILKYRGTFVMQDDIWGYCTGFFLVRPSMFGKILIQKCIRQLIANSEIIENDQHVFNRLCKKTAIISFIKLPLDEYPNGKVYFEDNKKASAKILHNNYLQTTAEKVQKFKDNNLWDESDTGFNLVNKYYI